MSSPTLPRERTDEPRRQDRVSPLLGRRTAWLVALVPLLLAVAMIVGIGEGTLTDWFKMAIGLLTIFAVVVNAWLSKRARAIKVET